MDNHNGKSKEVQKHHPNLWKRFKHAANYFVIGVICSVLVFLMIGLPKWNQTATNVKITLAISDELDSHNLTSRSSNLYQLIKILKPLTKEYFPNGEFTYTDLLAIAYIESRFNFLAIGKAGEVGCFQILDPKTELKELKMANADVFNPEVNAEMACNLLRKKYRGSSSNYKGSSSNYKEAIIRYNGASPYYDKFIRIRHIVDRAIAKLDYDGKKL